MGEAHPDFDWLGAKNHTRDSAKRFTRCVVARPYKRYIDEMFLSSKGVISEHQISLSLPPVLRTATIDHHTQHFLNRLMESLTCCPLAILRKQVCGEGQGAITRGGVLGRPVCLSPSGTRGQGPVCDAAAGRAQSGGAKGECKRTNPTSATVLKQLGILKQVGESRWHGQISKYSRTQALDPEH